MFMLSCACGFHCTVLVQVQAAKKGTAYRQLWWDGCWRQGKGPGQLLDRNGCQSCGCLRAAPSAKWFLPKLMALMLPPSLNVHIQSHRRFLSSCFPSHLTHAMGTGSTNHSNSMLTSPKARRPHRITQISVSFAVHYGG